MGFPNLAGRRPWAPDQASTPELRLIAWAVEAHAIARDAEQHARRRQELAARVLLAAGVPMHRACQLLDVPRATMRARLARHPELTDLELEAVTLEARRWVAGQPPAALTDDPTAWRTAPWAHLIPPELVSLAVATATPASPPEELPPT